MAKAEIRTKNPKLGRAARQRVLSRFLNDGEVKGVYKDPAVSAKPTKQPEADKDVIVGDDFFG